MINFKKIYKITILLTLLIPVFIHGQQVISPSGGTTMNAAGSWSYTLGELAIDTHISHDVTLTQGFHQPRLTATAIDTPSQPDFKIRAYPNPATDVIHLSYPQSNLGQISYRVTDSKGQEIANGELIGKETSIPFTGLKPAIYFIQVYQDQWLVKTLKIVKQY